MEILAINSSLRGDKGYSKFLIDKIFQGAGEAGAKCESITLSALNIHPCVGCLVCQTEKHHLKCVFEDKDDAKDVFDRMRRADIIIFATPVYVFGMSCLLKALLERVHSTGDVFDFTMSKSGMFAHTIDRDLCSKPFATLVVLDNVEDVMSKNITSFFDIYSNFMDAPCLGHLVRNAGMLTGRGKNPDKEKMCPRTYQVYDAYIQAGRELATTGKISGRTLRKANQEVTPIPFFKYLKHMKPLKPLMITKARKMMKEPTQK